MEAESKAFARDLMIYLRNYYNRKNYRLSGHPPFQETMGRTIIRFYAVFPKFLVELTSVICPEIRKNEEAFNDFAKTLLANYWKGYIFLELITMCSCISYVAVFKFGNPWFMYLGSKLIAMCFQKLQRDFYAEGGWPNFAIYCRLYVKVLEDLLRKNRQLKTSHGI